MTEKESVEPAPVAAPEMPAPADDSDDWRDEVVADIFDGPPLPKPPRSEKSFADFLTDWADERLVQEIRGRAAVRRRAFERRLVPRGGSRERSEHVFADPENGSRLQRERSTADPT